MYDDYKTYDFFPGKISPFIQFEMEYHSLFYVVEHFKEDKFYPEINPASQVATIGLLAYFEAFCKHQFAAIVNMFPALINGFAAKRNEPKIEYSTIISFNGEFEKNIVFVLAENFDFGTAKAINSLFRDLLIVTPFNKDEEQKFNDIVYKRNLLVHHAGYYTLQYLKNNPIAEKVEKKVFNEAVRINTEDFGEISDFLFEMACKINRETIFALRKLAEYKVLTDDERSKAIELMQGIRDSFELNRRFIINYFIHENP